MYQLGKISFEQGDMKGTIAYYEDAVKVHPHAIQAAEANYTLAQAYLELAEEHLSELMENMPESERRSVLTIVQTNRQRALDYFVKTEHLLVDRQRAVGLIEYEKEMLRNVHFMICAVLKKMERFEEVIPRLNTLATIYLDRPEALEALIEMALVQRVTGRVTEAQTTLRRAEVILNQFEKIGTIPDGTNLRNRIRALMQP
jgi:tetratricopeptide (TPR) repeat protein